MNLQDVTNLADLARIDIPDAEKESIVKDFEGILNYVRQIESVVLEGDDEDGNQLTPHNVWREDVQTSRDFSAQSIKDQFPAKHGDFLKVKKIL